MVGEPGSLTGFILDQLRRSEGTDIVNQQIQSGAFDPNNPLVQAAQKTGDMSMLPAVQQQSALSQLHTGNQNIDKVLPFMAPNEVVGAATNPMLMGNPSALGQINGQTQQPEQSPNGPAPLPWQAPSALSQLNQTTLQPANPTKPGLNASYLNTQVPPFYRNQVMDVISGGELAKDVSPRDRTLIMNWAHNTDPTFTETIGTQRNKMAGDIASNTPQSQGGQGVQLNSVAGHLYDLHEAADTLGNGDVPVGNSIANTLLGLTGSTLKPSGNGQQQLTSLSNYENILNRASPELNKFYVGGEGDKEGRASAKDAFASNLPSPIIKNNVKSQLGLLNSKATALQTTRDKIMGNASAPVLNPLSQALVSDIRGEPLTPQQQDMVNQHRAESNLPPKTWAAPQQPKVDPAAIQAELRKRGLLK